MRLSEAIDKYGVYRLTRANVSVNTWRGEKPGLEAFTRRFPYDLSVREIDNDDIGRWWDSLLLTDSTKATRLAQLRSFFRYLVDVGAIDSDPTRLLRAPSVAPEPRERLNADELLSLLGHARTPRDRALMALAMNLALRAGEIQRLTWADVHWGDETIRVRVDKTHEIDDMPITSDLMRELMLWASTIPTRKTRHELGVYVIPSQHIAPSGTVTYRWTQQVSEPFEVIKGALKAAGWDDVKQEGVHTIRRSVARLYFDKVEAEESFDSAILATMTLLHHTRPETTLTYIGRDRATLARDRIMRGQPFLSAMRTPTRLVGVAS